MDHHTRMSSDSKLGMTVQAIKASVCVCVCLVLGARVGEMVTHIIANI